VDFTGGAAAPGVGAMGTAEFSAICSEDGWLSICAKDEQHTLSDSDSLVPVGGPMPYYTSGTLVLRGGDTDNDNDVDINDVTWLLTQFGGLAAGDSCPWVGPRDSDFSLNGAVGGDDYQFISDNWLQFSNCCSPFGWPLINPIDPDHDDEAPALAPVGIANARASISVSELSDDMARADLNSDGVIDYHDVRIFEAAAGLSNELSSKMENTRETSTSDGVAPSVTKE